MDRRQTVDDPDAETAQLRVIAWCLDCRRQIEPDAPS
jgi:hypothetical protein